MLLLAAAARRLGIAAVIADRRDAARVRRPLAVIPLARILAID